MLRPNKDRSNRLILVLWIYTALVALSSISDLSQYFLLKRIETGNFGMGEIDANDNRQRIIALTLLALNIGVAVVFIQWFRRAYYNLHQLTNSLSHSEGWAAGAWFVPIMNLGRPFNIMREMMTVSENMLIRANLVQEKPKRRRSVGIWWTFWIGVSVLSDASARIQTKTESIAVLTNATLADAVFAILHIPLTIFTVRMIKNYAELETYLPQLESVNQMREIKIDDSDILDSI